MSHPGRTRSDSTRYSQMTKDERRASLRLLGSLLKPYTWQLVGVSLIVVLTQLMTVAGPAIIAWGIDHGLPALQDGNPVPAIVASAAHILAAMSARRLMSVVVRWNMSMGLNMLFRIRKRLLLHTQILAMAFHET